VRYLTFYYVGTLAFKQTPGHDDMGDLTYLRAIELWQKSASPFILRLQLRRKLKRAASHGM
jgi:hypothetical protein